jgi:threonine/homoserine/homoserine lactone efflux protein
MFPMETIVSFFTASLLLAAMPGPDNIFVLTQSALQGPRAGFTVTLGLCTGLVVHTTAVALGVAAVFHTSSIAYAGLMLAGACYLSYLAWQAFRASSTRITMTQTRQKPLLKLYGRGVIMNITNPKVSIFFLAFLPLFADPARGPLTLQIMGLGAIFIICTIIVFSAVALAAGFVGEWLNRSGNAQRIMNVIAGIVFTALAARILISVYEVLTGRA